MMALSKVFLYPALSFIAGIFLASFIYIPKLIIWEFFILGVFYLILFRKHKTIAIFAICLIFLSFGFLCVSQIYGSRCCGDSQPPQHIVFPQFGQLRQELREVIYENMSPPQSSILAAIVLGDKGKISQEWKEKLNIAGARHITAISGMHIVILSGILVWLGITIGLYRGQAFYFALILLWLFIVFI